MKKYSITAAVLILGFTVWFYTRHPLTATVTIRNRTYRVEVAATAPEKERGLGYRDSLPENSGMLFPYDHKEQFSYWMKGMRFPIDIIWIRDNQIVDISRNVPLGVNGNLPSYQPREPVNKVLEVNAGQSDTYGFTVGDLVHISD